MVKQIETACVFLGCNLVSRYELSNSLIVAIRLKTIKCCKCIRILCNARDNVFHCLFTVFHRSISYFL